MANVQGKRYLVFAGAERYAAGGWGDFVMATDDPATAIKRAQEEYDIRAGRFGGWAEVIDLVVSLPVWKKGQSRGS